MRPTLATCALLAAMLPAHAQQPKPTAALAWRVALPPMEFDRPYEGQLIVTKWKDYSLIRALCHKEITVEAIACSIRTWDTATGRPIACLIMLGPKVWDDERVLRHETGHCNGWANDHVGARQ